MSYVISEMECTAVLLWCSAVVQFLSTIDSKHSMKKWEHSFAITFWCCSEVL